MKNKMVLVLGSPRSGTTWLAKIFDSNEDVIYRHEPDSVYRNDRLPYIPENNDLSNNVQPALKYLGQLACVRTLKSSASFPSFSKSYRSMATEAFRNGLLLPAKLLEKTLGAFGIKLDLTIPDFVKSERADRLMIVIKSVSSLGRAKLFSKANPELKIVHIIRHPCAFVSSRLRGAKLQLMEIDTFLDSQFGMLQARRRGWTMEYLKSLTTEEQLASLWMLQNEKVMEEMHLNGNYKVVIYEHLCHKPIEIVEDLFAFSGLEITKQTVEFILSSQSGKHGQEQYYRVIRDSKVAVDRWKNELSARQVYEIENLVRESLPGKLFL